MQLFSTYLDLGEPVLIAIRDIKPDAGNPLSAAEVKELWETVYKNNELVKVIIIPDIASVNYGRGVGYEVNQLQVPDTISAISATEIRRQIGAGETAWKELVDPAIHDRLTQMIRSKGGD